MTRANSDGWDGYGGNPSHPSQEQDPEIAQMTGFPKTWGVWVPESRPA